jgi:hypothetical protein
VGDLQLAVSDIGRTHIEPVFGRPGNRMGIGMLRRLFLDMTSICRFSKQTGHHNVVV